MGTALLVVVGFWVTIASNGNVYLCVDIQTTVGGTISDANHVAVWDDTGSWKSLGSGLGSIGSQIVNCLGIDNEDRVFFGGVFSRGWEPSRSASNSVSGSRGRGASSDFF